MGGDGVAAIANLYIMRFWWQNMTNWNSV